MGKEDGITVVVRECLATAGVEISRAELVALVERRLGRPLTPKDMIGLREHGERQRFMRATGQEIISKRGRLSVASAQQSINRRGSKHRRAIRTLVSNAEEIEILSRREDLSGDQRRQVARAREKNADLELDLQNLARRRLRLPPEG